VILVELEVDGLRAHIEYVHRLDPAAHKGAHESYVARIIFGDPGFHLVKSFGNGVRAEDWLLEQLSNPSYLYLKYT